MKSIVYYQVIQKQQLFYQIVFLHKLVPYHYQSSFFTS
nr:MAG TPA: hypothetical protein [Caudoviricetes sp.]